MVAAAPLARGSTAAPKVRARTDRGDFLIKRRAPNKADPLRVAASHEVQVRLVDTGFPAPALCAMPGDGATALHHAGHVYEAMAWVAGDRYARAPAQARDSGALLARFHAGMNGFSPRFALAKGRLHASSRVVEWLSRRERSTPERTTRELRRLYNRAAERVEAAGLAKWEARVIHGDWHPGNLLFVPGGVAAAVDFDAVRRGTAAEDVAVGAVYFSLIGEGADRSRWPDEPDVGLLAAFLSGYRSAGAPPWIARGGAEAIPYLMVESLLSEAVLTLRIAEPDASPVTREMIYRKCSWMEQHAGHIASLAAGA